LCDKVVKLREAKVSKKKRFFKKRGRKDFRKIVWILFGKLFGIVIFASLNETENEKQRKIRKGIK
jgi:hypothetical protein